MQPYAHVAAPVAAAAAVAAGVRCGPGRHEGLVLPAWKYKKQKRTHKLLKGNIPKSVLVKMKTKPKKAPLRSSTMMVHTYRVSA